MEIWNTIVKTNTLNFIVFLLFFVWVGNKFRIMSIIESAQQKVIKTIDDARAARAKSENDLKNNEVFVSKVGKEINDMLVNADETAERIGKKIMKEAELQVSNILSNSDKLIESEAQKIISSLSQKTMLSSIEIAKNHIIDVTKRKPQYHADFINDCIEELDRLKI